MGKLNILPKGAQPVTVGDLPESTVSFSEIPLIPITVEKAIRRRGKFFLYKLWISDLFHFDYLSTESTRCSVFSSEIDIFDPAVMPNVMLVLFLLFTLWSTLIWMNDLPVSSSWHYKIHLYLFHFILSYCNLAILKKNTKIILCNL